MCKKTSRRLREYSALVVFCLLAASCSPKPGQDQDTPAAVFVLFDVSESTQSREIRRDYLKDFGTIVEALAKKGGILRGDVVGGNPLAESKLRINVAFPQYSLLLSNKPKYDRTVAEKRTDVRRQAEEALQAQVSTTDTALMDGIAVAAKTLNGEDCREVPFRALVLFSDMVEESTRANFKRNPISEARVQQILAAERSSHRLPDLKGVKIWVAGAGASKNALAADRLKQIEGFWMAYFTETGAKMVGERYSSSLLNFNLQTN